MQENTQFNLIADYEGDLQELLNTKHKGTLPVLPLRNMMLFPGVVVPIAVSRTSSKQLIDYAVKKGEGYFIAVASQIEPEVAHPVTQDLYPIATLARLLQVDRMKDQSYHVVLQAYGRIELKEHAYHEFPYLRTGAVNLEERLPETDNQDWKALYDSFHSCTMEYLQANERVSPEARYHIDNIKNPFYFVNYVATNLPITLEEKALLLYEDDYVERTFRILSLLQRELRYLQLRKAIEEKTGADLDRQQREFYLRQELRNIQRELSDGENPDVEALKKKCMALSLPKAVSEIFDREIQKLERTPPATPDYHVMQTYLETITSLPWGKRTDDDMNVARARRILGRDHYGMDKVKERILEHLAILRYSTSRRAPILCLYGPPGVGKTSLGRSIAESLGRRYVRMSLGGLHDESEIRGHRRTYIGAMCGRVMKGIIRGGSLNPVFILDEIDKVGGQSFNGDPQSALLELLDPEQNSAFHDNYLDFDFDLSNVFFIATANNIGNIPPALRDRMELIEVEGYITEEKREILRRHILPQTLAPLQLPHPIKLTAAALDFLIERYTRESGVRQLKKEVERLVRKVVLENAESAACQSEERHHSLRPADVERYLGTPPFIRDEYQEAPCAGVVTGLAWTAVGGDILYIETSLSRSKTPCLTTTGNLGDVMKESATLALEYVKAHASLLQIDPRIFEQWSIHIHVPEGATPKDGPSAGITIATSLASALTQRAVHPHLAMTGEITLRGKVLPVGGIKEKILAAKRAGISHIVLCSENRKDIDDIPEKYLKGVTFHYVNTVAEVWDIALLDVKAPDHIELTISDL